MSAPTRALPQRQAQRYPRPLTEVQQRIATALDRHLDGALDEQQLLDRLFAVWPVHAGDPASPRDRAVMARALHPHLEELRAAVRVHQHAAGFPCGHVPACTARELCAGHRDLHCAWLDVLHPAVRAVEALPTGVRPQPGDGAP